MSWKSSFSHIFPFLDIEIPFRITQLSFFRQAFVKSHCLLFRIWLWGNIWGAKVNSIYWTRHNLTNFFWSKLLLLPLYSNLIIVYFYIYLFYLRLLNVNVKYNFTKGRIFMPSHSKLIFLQFQKIFQFANLGLPNFAIVKCNLQNLILLGVILGNLWTDHNG